MFDNQTNPVPGQVPSNLPVGEPDDMFAGSPNESTESVVQSQPVPEQISPEQPQAILSDEAPQTNGPTALSAGVLQVKTNPPTNPSVAEPGAPTNYGQPTITEGLRPEENVLRDPFGGRKVLITVVTLLSLGILGGGGAWLYFSLSNSNSTPVITSKPTVPVTPPQPTAPVVIPVTTSTNSGTNNPATSTDQRILFGEPVLDTDSDGLDDATEKKLGTNMLAWDTDGDGLSDGDEVLTWKTDPLKKDTDGDGYSDGEEIKNGYNPNGPGKLFPQIPTSTPQK